MFTITAVPFDDYDALDIADGPRWLLVRLARYADREGRCFPSMRTLAAAAKKSVATVCRWLKRLFDQGCFTRTRKAGRVYHYTLAETYRLRWREQPKPAAAEGVSPAVKQGVSHGARQEAYPSKYEEKRSKSGLEQDALPPPVNWAPRLRSWAHSRFWLPTWGPRPNEAGCWAPPGLL
jgi:DNA-binding transcriptional regulator YhcF (GntR family)